MKLKLHTQIIIALAAGILVGYSFAPFAEHLKIIGDLLNNNEFTVYSYEIIPDDSEQIKDKLCYYSDRINLDLVLTTGGTGFGPRDITPEATRAVIEKEVPGIPELIRSEGCKTTNRASLSRAIAGIRKNTLIINLPGSAQGAKESLLIILPIIGHGIDMPRGKKH